MLAHIFFNYFAVLEWKAKPSKINKNVGWRVYDLASLVFTIITQKKLHLNHKKWFMSLWIKYLKNKNL